MSVNFIDTNVVIYSLSNDDEKRLKALEILANKPVISAQVLNETVNVLQRKLKLNWQATQVIINSLIKESYVVPLSSETTLAAMKISERYQYSWFDSLIIAAALEANCRVLYSEDMQHKQIIENQLQIINPFN